MTLDRAPFEVERWTLPPAKVRPREGDPKYVIWHATRGPQKPEQQYSATVGWFIDDGNVEFGQGPSADLLVGRAGEVAQFTDFDAERANYSAGYGVSSAMTFAADEWGISIEVAQSAALEDYTDAQMETCAWLMARFKREYAIPFKRLPELKQLRAEAIPMGHVGHQDTAHGQRVGKTDPGSLFPWARIFARAAQIEMGESTPAPPAGGGDVSGSSKVWTPEQAVIAAYDAMVPLVDRKSQSRILKPGESPRSGEEVIAIAVRKTK